MSRLVTTLGGYQRQFVEEAENNPRFRRLLWMIAYILICYLIVSVFDENQALKSRAVQLASELGRISKVDNLEIWKQREDSEREVHQQLLSRCWQAPSQGIASADMQTVLQQLLSNYELKGSRLTLSEPEQYELGEGKLWLIRAQVRGRIERANVPPLVNALESPVSFFGIDRLYFLETRGGSLDMVVRACFKEGKS